MDTKQSEFIGITLIRLRTAATHLSSVIYGSRDDEDDLDLLKAGCKVGMAWELINLIHYEFKNFSAPEIDVESISYNLRNMMSYCENMIKTARNDVDNVDMLKLGNYVGMVYQQLHDMIEELQRKITVESVEETTEQMKAEAALVPTQDIFRYAVAQETVD